MDRAPGASERCRQLFFGLKKLTMPVGRWRDIIRAGTIFHAGALSGLPPLRGALVELTWKVLELHTGDGRPRKFKRGERRRLCGRRSKTSSWDKKFQKLLFTSIFHDKSAKNINNRGERLTVCC